MNQRLCTIALTHAFLGAGLVIAVNMLHITVPPFAFFIIGTGMVFLLDKLIR